MVLLGPGVMEETNANNTNAEINSRENGMFTSGVWRVVEHTLTDHRASLALQLRSICTAHIGQRFLF